MNQLGNHYNEVHPHKAVGYRSPHEFIAACGSSRPASGRSGLKAGNSTLQSWLAVNLVPNQRGPMTHASSPLELAAGAQLPSAGM